MRRRRKIARKVPNRVLAKRKAKTLTVVALKGYCVVKRRKRGYSGLYTSDKLEGPHCVFRSALEFSFFRQLDNDPDVVSWSYESVRIPYTVKGVAHHYKPDCMVHYEDYSELVEVKPSKKVSDRDVCLKANAAIAFAETLTTPTTFKFVTELELPNYTETLILLRK